MKSGIGRGVLLVAALLALTMTSHAQTDFRVWEPANGVFMRQGYHIEWYRSMASDENGNTCVVWSDTRLGGRDLYAQLIDNDGNMLWGDDGTLIAQWESRQEDPNVMPAGDGEWIITWVDYRYDIDIEDIGDIYIQKLNSNGEPQWSTDSTGVLSGIPVCVAPDHQIWVQSFSDGEGGAVSIWVDGRNGSADIYAQRTDSDGNALWDTDGIMVAGGVENQGSLGGGGYTADTDGAGGIIFGWVDTRNPTNQNLYANRVDVNGDLIWDPDPTSGLPLCLASGEQSGVKMAPDGMGGAFFSWSDKRADGFGDLYGQRVDADGNIFWADDGEVICNAPFTQFKQRIVNSAPGEAIIVWQDQRVDAWTNDLYIQRISGTDEIVLNWGDPDTLGIVLSDAIRNQEQVRLTADGEGGAVFTWTDERIQESPRHDLYGQRVNSDGERLWGDPNGIVLCDADLSQEGNIVRVLNNGRAAVTWLDFREGSPGIYFQLFNLPDGNEILDHNGDEIVYGIDFNCYNPQTLYDGTNLYVGWEDGRDGDHGRYAYIQKVDPLTGANLFDLNGIKLTPGLPLISPDDTLEVDVDSVTFTIDEDGSVFAAWQDNRRSLSLVIAAQKMSSDGTMLWGDQGIQVAPPNEGDPSRDQIRPRILPSGDGGLYVIFIKSRSDWWQNIHMQKLDSDGNPQWDYGDPYGLRITDDEYDHIVEGFDFFDDGNILVLYHRNEGGSNYDLFAQCVDPDGNIVWDEPVTISAAEGFQYRANIVRVDGGILTIWEDTRRGSPTIDIYGQIIHPDGSLAWDDENGRVLIAEDAAQSKLSLGVREPGDDTFWLTWQDSRNPNDPDIYAQRFDLTGSALIEPASGIRVSGSVSDQDNPKLIVGEENDAWITWEDSEGSYFVDLRYTHLNFEGVPYDGYDDNGLILCDAYHLQGNVNMVYYVSPQGAGGFVSAWEDRRSTGKEHLFNVYAQEVVDGYTGVSDREHAATPSRWDLEAAWPNPFNPATNISFQVGEASVVRLTVYDLLGRKVAQLVNQRLSAGDHHVVWDGRDFSGRQVASGTYFYRLEADGVQIARSMILLK